MNFGGVVLSILILTFSNVSLSDELDNVGMDDETLGSGYVYLEGGQLRLLGAGQAAASHPIVGYVNVGMSLTRAFYSPNDYEPLKIGPKIGGGFGRLASGQGKTFWDALMTLRYTFLSPAMHLRPFLDGAVGVINYDRAQFEWEAGGGLEWWFGSGSIGVNAQYKGMVGQSVLDEGIAFLVAFGYHF